MKKLTNKIKYIFPYLINFISSNYIVLLTVLLVWIKVISFNYVLNLLDLFPYILRTLAVGFMITFVTFSPLFFIKRGKAYLSFVLNLFFSLVIIMDSIYLRYFNSLPSVGIFNTINQSSDVIPAIKTLFHYRDLLFLIDIPILLVFINLIRTKVAQIEIGRLSKKKIAATNFSAALTGGLLLVILFVVDTGFFPAAINNVLDNKVTVENYGVIGAHYFDIYRNVSQNFRKLSQVEIKNTTDWLNQHKFVQENNTFTGIAKDKNVIMIQVESLASLPINKKIEGQEITPNFNKLANQSHFFDNNYFEVGGGGSSDADFSANTSIYPSDTESAFVKYGKDSFSSLAKDIKDAGYSTYAYHGFNRSFWNRNIAFPSLGYDKFISAESYPKGELLGLGLNDNDYFIKTAELIKTQPRPSFSYLITLTSHTPFELPAKDKTLKLPGNYPELSANYLQSIHYTDAAFGKFVESLKKDGLYNDSLVVLYGDHNANIEDFNIGELKYSVNSLDDKKVPLLIKLPGQGKQEIHHEVSSHVDIMPTILNLVGKTTSSPMFGRDLFGKSTPFFTGVGHFNAGTVFSGDKRAYTDSENNLHCEIRNSNLQYVSAGLNECEGLVDKSTEIKIFNEKLIRFNLFKYFIQ